MVLTWKFPLILPDNYFPAGKSAARGLASSQFMEVEAIIVQIYGKEKRKERPVFSKQKGPT
jgi:hypothetical protein